MMIDLDEESFKKQNPHQPLTYSVNGLNLNSNYAKLKRETLLETSDIIMSSSRTGDIPIISASSTIRPSTFGNVSRSIDLPVPSTPPSHPRMAEKKYWKLSFRIVLLPLIILGVPSHLVLMKRPIKCRSDWFKSLIRHLGIFIFSLFMFIYSMALAVYVLRHIVDMFILLVIQGNLDAIVVLNFVNLIQNLPILLPIIFIWIWGYVLRDLILSFTRPTVSDSFLQNPDLTLGSQPQLPGRMKLIIMYFLILFIHSIHIYMFSVRVAKNDPDVITVLDHFASYFIGPVFSTLMLPIYSTFCWACERHYTVLENYVKTLIGIRAIPDVSYFNRFKFAYKELSDRIQLVNRFFALYLSWVMLTVLISIYVDGWDLTNVFFTSMINPDNSLQTNPDGPLFPPELVRSIVGFVVIILLKCGLLIFVAWQAVGVNDTARSLNIWLNDFVTEPEANICVNKYHAFRLLKFYVRSRMQQPLPSLLRIPLTNGIPFLKSRLNPSFVDQY